ncbi:MAG: hypothetical protein JW384_01011 [Nitrosomonadaceae bacterium]|nr:hypothetical protein [Nitrosomonadaceae bacterium]
MLSDIHEGDTTRSLTGIGGSVSTSTVGTFSIFGEVSLCEGALANILCFADVAREFRITWKQREDCFVVHTPKGDLVFANVGKIYKANLLHLAHSSPPLLCNLNTVEENKAKYTKREVIRAEVARTVARRLGLPGENNIIRAVQHGTLLNVPSTSADFYRANKIWGMNIANLKGKSTMSNPTVPLTEYVPRSLQSSQTMFADIFYVNGVPFFLSICTPLWLYMVTKLPNGRRSEAAIKEVLVKHLSAVASNSFTIGAINTDHEGGMQPIIPWIQRNRIQVISPGAGEHVPVIERGIRVVKERVRAHATTFPFRLSQTFMCFLVYFCVYTINLLPNSNNLHHRSAKEMFTGIKVDYAVSAQVSFMEYVQTVAPDPQPASLKSDVKRERTEGCLALLPSGNQTGSILFWSLAKGSLITRTVFNRLPMPNTVIAEINRLADLDNSTKSYSPDPTFTFNDREVALVDDAPDLVEPDVPAILPPLRLVGVDDDEPRIVNADDAMFEDNSMPADLEPTVELDHGGGDMPIRAAPDELIAEDVEDGDEDDGVSEYFTEDGQPKFKSSPQPVQADSLQRLFGGNVGKSRRQLSAGVSSQHSATQRARLGAQIQGSNSTHGVLHITVKAALKKMPKAALKSMTQEFLQLDAKDFAQPVNISALSSKQMKSIIRSSLFLKEKFLSTGEFEKLKSRLVAGGNMQDRSLYDDVSSPTATTSSIFLVAAIAAKEGRKVAKADIGGAFLRAHLPEDTEILMRLDPVCSAILAQIAPKYKPYFDTDGSLVVKLTKALYGCIESAKLWYENLSATLTSMGFVVNPLDVCVFNLVRNGKQCTICVHVDDLFITCVEESTIKFVTDSLLAKYKEIEVKTGPILSYIGMTFNFSTIGKCFVTMEGYVQDVINLYSISGHANTPATSDLFTIRPDSPLLSESERKEFHSRVPKLQYLAKRVRPDMLPACSFLASRVLCATQDDNRKLDHLLRYLNSTRELGLCLEPGAGALSVHAFIDASYGVHSDFKSHSGFFISIGRFGGPSFAKSSKQKLVTKSSTEADLVALSDSVSQVIWTGDFLIAQGYELGPSHVYQDNKSTITLADKGRSTSERTRHINIRYFFIKDRSESGEIAIEYLPTLEMISDVLTKPLQGALFVKLRRALLNLQ